MSLSLSLSLSLSSLQVLLWHPDKNPTKREEADEKIRPADRAEIRPLPQIRSPRGLAEAGVFFGDSFGLM